MSRRQRRAEAKQLRHRPSGPRGAATGGLALAATLLSGSVAEAATYTVTTNADGAATAANCTPDATTDPSCSLRDAVAAATGNETDDTIVFASTVTGSVSLTQGQLNMSNDTHALAIQGPGAGVLAVDAHGASRVFDIYYAANATISGLTVENGHQPSGQSGRAPNGGGIYQYGGVLTLAGDVFSGNSALPTGFAYAGQSGGGIFVARGDQSTPASLTVRGSTFTQNTAKYGGAIGTSGATLTIENSTFGGNTVTERGGAVFVSTGAATITGSTIAGNAVQVPAGQSYLQPRGGGLYARGSEATPLTVTVQDSVIANNTSTDATGAPAATGADVFTGYNSTLSAAFDLIRDTSGATFSSEDAATTANAGKDPQLGALADNGGPTPTMLPAPTSPLVDGGSAFGLTADQRGITRPQGSAADIGAVELAPPAAVTKDATGVGQTAATLNGSENVHGLAGSWHFEYGTDDTYGSSTPTQTAPGDSQDHSASADISGLSPHTTYHFRLVVINHDGTTRGADTTFTTGAPPPPPPPPPPPVPPTVTNLGVNPRCISSASLALNEPHEGTNGLSFHFDLSEDSTVTYELFRRANSPKWTRCPRPGQNVSASFYSIGKSSSQETQGHHNTTLASSASVRRSYHSKPRSFLTRRGRRHMTLARLLAGQHLAPGTYLMRVTATNSAGQMSNIATVLFWVFSSGGGR